MDYEIHSEESRHSDTLYTNHTWVSSAKDSPGGCTIRHNQGPLVDSLRRVWEASGFCGSGQVDQVERYRLFM